jgi:hypothetical protein
MPRAAIGEAAGAINGALSGRLASEAQQPAQGLPQVESGAGQQAEIVAKSLILLVGATGFEPVTWSTQNSRATRLRYAPGLSRRGLDTRFAVRQQAAPHGRQSGAALPCIAADVAWRHAER